MSTFDKYATELLVEKWNAYNVGLLCKVENDNIVFDL